ncbi:MAG: hypothetical protein WCC60_16960 [Ilumatobacteraceae bacterium]
MRSVEQLISGGGMRTQVFYHEWSAKGGRVRFTSSAVEVRFSRCDPNTWIGGLWATRVIPYQAIHAGFTGQEMIRVVFDTDDEIMFHRRVLAQCPAGSPPFVMLEESFDAGATWDVVEAMRDRQRVLPPVSWAEGRQSDSPRSWQSVRAVHLLPVLVAVGLLVWGLVR